MELRCYISFIERLTLALAFGLLLSTTALAQVSDITGWRNLPWGSTQPAALKALSGFGVKQCPSAPQRPCAAMPGAEELVIESYLLYGISYEVRLHFLPKYGLGRVTMTAPDDRESFQKTLATLAALYGKPGLQSEYDGGTEVTRTTWTWVKPHGKVSLSSDDAEGPEGRFTVFYDPRR